MSVSVSTINIEDATKAQVKEETGVDIDEVVKAMNAVLEDKEGAGSDPKTVINAARTAWHTRVNHNDQEDIADDEVEEALDDIFRQYTQKLAQKNRGVGAGRRRHHRKTKKTTKRRHRRTRRV